MPQVRGERSVYPTGTRRPVRPERSPAFAPRPPPPQTPAGEEPALLTSIRCGPALGSEWWPREQEVASGKSCCPGKPRLSPDPGWGHGSQPSTLGSRQGTEGQHGLLVAQVAANELFPR